MVSPKITVCLENIRSAYNVGSIFRTSDAAGIDRLILTGLSAHPPHPRLEKTALGSTKSVSWEYHERAIDVISTLKQSGTQIIAFEKTQTSTSIFDWSLEQDSCLIFGNEVEGVSQDLINLSDNLLHIPMFGIKTSLNVSVAAGVGMYEVVRQRLLLSA